MRSRLRARLRLVMLVALLALLAWSGAAFALVRYGRGRQANGHVDAIVVLGCRVDEDGRPSPALADRVRTAVALYHAGLAPRFVTTGGFTGHGFAEAEVAATYARELGVPADAILVENASQSTEENARFAAALAPGQSVLLVTDAYHVFRSERVFARYFARVHGVGAAPSASTQRLLGAMREVPVLVAYALLGRLS